MRSYKHLEWRDCRANKDEAERWCKVVRRFELKATLERNPDEIGWFMQMYKPKALDEKSVQIKTYNAFSSFLDSVIYWIGQGQENELLILWDQFLPSKSIYIEKEIHKWIKEYKELPD
jgi:hypothetical protein